MGGEDNMYGGKRIDSMFVNRGLKWGLLVSDPMLIKQRIVSM